MLLNPTAYTIGVKDRDKQRECERAYYERHKEEIRARKREQMRARRAANPERSREANKRSREKHIEKNRERQREYYEANKDRVLERNREWFARNPGKAAAYQAAWRVRNPGKQAEFQQRWAEQNRDKVRQIARNYRARRRGAEGSHSVADIAALLTRQRGRCAECGVAFRETGFHVDHIVPVSKGGGNGRRNLQLLCPGCNRSKGAKLPEDWARTRGRLL